MSVGLSGEKGKTQEAIKHIEQIKQYFTGNINLGQRIRCKIQRKGDLLSNMYVVFDICKSDCLQQIPIRKLGLKLIEYIDIEIGGQLIDRHYGEWLDVWSQLSHTYEEYQMTKILMGDSERINIFNTSMITIITINTFTMSIVNIIMIIIFIF